MLKSMDPECCYFFYGLLLSKNSTSTQDRFSEMFSFAQKHSEQNKMLFLQPQNVTSAKHKEFFRLAEHSTRMANNKACVKSFVEGFGAAAECNISLLCMMRMTHLELLNRLEAGLLCQCFTKETFLQSTQIHEGEIFLLKPVFKKKKQ